jgi:hypothetical protein
MSEHLQLTYVAQVKNTEEWLEALVVDIEGRIDATKEAEPTLEGATESLEVATQSLAAIQSQRAALLDIRDNKLDVQSRKDDVTRVVQECRRAEEIIKQWISWLNYQDHRLSRLRDEDSSLPTE